MRIALQALRRNVMRTVLTMLGVIIGVAAVIAMMEISQGASVAIQVTVTQHGRQHAAGHCPALRSAARAASAKGPTPSRPKTPRPSQRECPTVVCTAPIVDAWGQVVYGNRSWNPIYLTGSTPAFLEARNWTDLELGRVFNEREVLSGSKVCLIGKTLVRELFGDRNPIGEEIRVKNVPFKVIGVLSEKGRQPAGHRPGRHPVGALDHGQVPHQRRRQRTARPPRRPDHAPPGLSLAERLPGTQHRSAPRASIRSWSRPSRPRPSPRPPRKSPGCSAIGIAWPKARPTSASTTWPKSPTP